MIETDEKGVPLEPPVQRKDESAIDFMRRRWAFNEQRTAIANKAFSKAFREAMRRPR